MGSPSMVRRTPSTHSGERRPGALRAGSRTSEGCFCPPAMLRAQFGAAAGALGGLGASPSPFALPELDKRTRGPAPRAEPSFEASGSHMVLLSVFSFFLW